MQVQEIIIDLSRRPADRWHLTPAQLVQARELLATYKRDLGPLADLAGDIATAAEPLIPAEYWSEMESLANAADVPFGDLALCNLYYDILKFAIGCTAFAVNAEEHVLHARNLDWWTENSALSRSTAVCRFVGGPAGEFITIGWPGFVGAFSGVAKGRFAISLNAVISHDDAETAIPVVLLIRKVLEEAACYADALAILTEAAIPCDCLLLITGTHCGEMAVIERTPTRHAVRQSEEGFMAVTNNYLLLPVDLAEPHSQLTATSCGRLARVQQLLGVTRPVTAQSCLECLTDPDVRMGITVQQKVFRAATGEYWVQLPSSPEVKP